LGGDVHQGPRRFARNVFIMVGFASDHRAQGDEAGVIGGRGMGFHGPDGEADGARNLKDAGHRQPVMAEAGFFELPLRTFRQFIGDVLVKPCFDDQDAAFFGHVSYFFRVSGW